MSAEGNKALVMRVIDGINRRDWTVFDELLAPNFVEHNPPQGLPETGETTKQLLMALTQAFPDFQYEVHLTFAEGDRVAQHLVAHGTMKGEFLGMPPTGKSATWTESHMARIVNGKFVDHWANIDQVAMMQQLGLMPAPAQSPK
jgi:predicted ester cyclase